VEAAIWGGPGHVIAFSPDAKTLAHGGIVKLKRDYDVDFAKAKHDGPADRAVWTPDSALLIVSAARHVHFVDVTAKKVVATLPSGESILGLSAMALSPDGQRLASAGDQSIALVLVKDGSVLARFVAVGSNDYAAITPTGHYAASRGAMAAIHFSRGKNILPIESFDLVFNRPSTHRSGTACRTRASRVCSTAFPRGMSCCSWTPAFLARSTSRPSHLQRRARRRTAAT